MIPSAGGEASAVGPGGHGGILGDPFRIRSEAKDIVRILQFGGVFSPEEIRTILRVAAPLAKKSADRNKVRDYSAVMKILLEAAKVEQAERLIAAREHEIDEELARLTSAAGDPDRMTPEEALDEFAALANAIAARRSGTPGSETHGETNGQATRNGAT